MAPALLPINPMGMGARTVNADSPKILIVDDDEAIRLALDLMVEELGLQADAVTNGREALEALRAHQYALVLMDLQMPVCDGITATRLIRETLPADRQPAIVGLTGNAFEDLRARTLAAGMDECLFKPIALAALQTVIRRWLWSDEHRGPRSSR